RPVEPGERWVGRRRLPAAVPRGARRVPGVRRRPDRADPGGPGLPGGEFLITGETCLILTGMPGAGKSTVTRLVAERLPRSARDRRDGPGAGGLDAFLHRLARRRVCFVVLAPGIEVCRYRNTIRDPRDRFDFDGYESLEA